MSWKDQIKNRYTSPGRGWREEVADKYSGALRTAPDTAPPPEDPHVKTKTTSDGRTIQVYQTRAKVPGELLYGKYPQSKTVVQPPPEDKIRVPDFNTLVVGSITKDPRARLRLYAEAAGEDESRYDIDDGRIVRQADDGIFYPVVPKSTEAEIKEAVANLPKDVIKGVVAGSILLAPGAGPMAAVAKIVAMGVAEAGLEYGERKLAKKALGEQRSDAQVLTDTMIAGGVGLTGATGTKTAATVSQAIANKLLRSKSGTIGKLFPREVPIDKAETVARQQRFERFDIGSAGTGRTTGDPVVGAVERHVRSQPRVAGAFTEQDKRLQDELERAVVEGRGGLGRTLQPGKEEVAGAAIKAGALKREASLRAKRQMASRKAYKEAFQEAEKVAGGKVDITSTLTKVDQRIAASGPEAEKNFWKSIKKDLVEMGKDDQGRKVAKQKNQIKQLDRTFKLWGNKAYKKELGEKTGLAVMDKELKEVRNWLRYDIDKVTGDKYSKAVNIYRRHSKKLADFEGEKKATFLSRAAEAGPEQYAGIAKELFDGRMSPQSVARIKRQILKTKHGRTTWDTITQAAATDVIKGLKKLESISDEKMAILEAALTGKQREAFAALRQVIDDLGFIPIGRVVAGPGGVGERELKRTVGAIGYGAGRATPSPIVQSYRITENQLRRAAPKLAKELTTKDGVEKLLRLNQISDRQTKWLEFMAYASLRPGARLVGPDSESTGGEGRRGLQTILKAGML